MMDAKRISILNRLPIICAIAFFPFLTGQEGGCTQADNDGDGWTTEDGDCDDDDSSIHPGALELCDELDNDCDGETDEDCGLASLGSHADYDVDADGNLITVASSSGVLAKCYDSSLEQVGELQVTSSSTSNITVYMSPESDFAVVSWRSDGVTSRLINKSCEAVTSEFNSISSGYGEFYDVVVDNDGSFTIAENDGSYTRIAWYDNTGTEVASDAMEVYGYGTHLAMNRSTGEGIILVQDGHSGDVITYRRWSSPGVWIDSDLVYVPVGYAYWYDGATVGMNENSEFVIEWRYSDASMQAAFYSADGEELTSLTFSTEVRPGESYYYDAYRRRHSPIVAHCDDFILGEVYSFASSDYTYGTYYRYTAAGEYVEDYWTDYTWAQGLSHRMDGSGTSFFSDGSTIEFGAVFTPCR